MIWLVAILLALAAFGIAVLLFRLPVMTWTSLLAALALGLTGFALQATPGVPGAPKASGSDHTGDEWHVVETRKALITPDEHSQDPMLITADAFARRGRFEDAANMLSGVVDRSPGDFEAWVALGNALTEQADGMLTPAAVYAFTKAQQLQPDNPAPNYFLGLSLIRQQRFMEARQVWQQALDQTAKDSDAHSLIATRLERLDELLSQMGALPPSASTGSQ